MLIRTRTTLGPQMTRAMSIRVKRMRTQTRMPMLTPMLTPMRIRIRMPTRIRMPMRMPMPTPMRIRMPTRMLTPTRMRMPTLTRTPIQSSSSTIATFSGRARRHVHPTTRSPATSGYTSQGVQRVLERARESRSSSESDPMEVHQAVTGPGGRVTTTKIRMD